MSLNGSLIGGILLLALGARSRGFTRLMTMASGGYMLYNGLSAGWCAGAETQESAEHQRNDAMVDESSMESFPASDPPSWTGVAV